MPKHGDGFVLRSFTPADAELLAEIEFDREVKRYLAVPEKDKQQWIQEFSHELGYGWAVEASHDGTLAGRASISRSAKKGEGELVIVISKAFWGYKLGRKVAALLIPAAFKELEAKALVAIVHPENQASLDLLKFWKFKYCGTNKTPAKPWQKGHLVFRLTREAYNHSVKATGASKSVPAA